jgi:hypothetical protein
VRSFLLLEAFIPALVAPHLVAAQPVLPPSPEPSMSAPISPPIVEPAPSPAPIPPAGAKWPWRGEAASVGGLIGFNEIEIQSRTFLWKSYVDHSFEVIPISGTGPFP